MTVLYETDTVARKANEAISEALSQLFRESTALLGLHISELYLFVADTLSPRWFGISAFCAHRMPVTGLRKLRDMFRQSKLLSEQGCLMVWLQSSFFLWQALGYRAFSQTSDKCFANAYVCWSYLHFCCHNHEIIIVVAVRFSVWAANAHSARQHCNVSLYNHTMCCSSGSIFQLEQGSFPLP